VDMRRLKDEYERYVDSYRQPDGALPVMMRLKRAHTAFVVKNAEIISQGEGFCPQTCGLCLAAALLHDVGRYEQLKRYDTFKDSESVDHAVLGHRIVTESGWLATWDRPLAACVEKAILFHNRRAMPDDMDPVTAVVSHAVRDADKLDILRVLEDQVAGTDWKSDARAFWNLAVKAPPSSEVVGCIEREQPVDYRHVRVLADFVLVQVGWMASGLHFPTSRRLCRERGHVEFRRGFLRQLTDDPSVDRICSLAESALGRESGSRQLRAPR